MTNKQHVQLELSSCFSTYMRPREPVLTLPPLVVPVYHASISSALPCTVILYSSAMVPPVTSAPWKKTSLIWIAPTSASQNCDRSGFWRMGLALCIPSPHSVQAVGTSQNRTGSSPMLLRKFQGGQSHGQCTESRGQCSLFS